jgi:twitching motility protein PilJ
MASLIQNISETGHDQTRIATAINKNMQVLTQISGKTKQSTARTSVAISKLSQLASQLRETVRGFRLPEALSAAGILSQDPGDKALERDVAAEESGVREAPRARQQISG